MRAWLELIAGGGLLYFGAEWLVSGAAGLALSLGIAQLVVGLTVVAYGTSAPELVVGVGAALRGDSAIALGNVVGSNIANIGLILGIAALIRPPRIDGNLRGRELPVLVVSALALVLVSADGVISRLDGAALVAGALAYSAWTLRSIGTVRARADARTVEDAATRASGTPPIEEGARPGRGRLILLSVVGLLVLIAGGNAFVSGASALAHTFGISPRMVGLTVVAFGTSLPELAASAIAAWRGHSDLAVGNVLGSNIFNVLLVLGLTALVHPITVAPEANTDGLVALCFTFFAAFFVRSARTLIRLEGALLILGYATYVAHLARGAFSR